MLTDNPQTLPLKSPIFRNFEESETLHYVYYQTPKGSIEGALTSYIIHSC